MSRAVMIFARLPEVEAAAKHLPPQMAKLFRAFTVGWLRAAARSGATPVIACDAGTGPRFDAILPGVKRLYVDQCGATFGARLAASAAATFALGFDEVLIAGIDARPPHVPAVFTALRGVRAVVGPARDGGINFIALRAPEIELLSSIEPRQRDLLARCRAYFDSVFVFGVSIDVDACGFQQPVDIGPPAARVIPSRFPRRHTTRPPPTL